MCTAISRTVGGHYFGRTLDLEYSYKESVTFTPRRYPLSFRNGKTAAEHYAVLGIAAGEEKYPLYYDGMNERGLCMAALHYPDNTRYLPPKTGMDNVASFEVIPWILGQCASVRQARDLLGRMNVTDTPFREQLPPSPLHWILADSEQCVVLEPGKAGLAVYENPLRVLTNNPPFPFQLDRLRDYRTLSPDPAPASFQPGIPMHPYSRGMSGMGLPGDYSSVSRFVRAAFVRTFSSSGGESAEKTVQFFRMTGAVQIPRGVVRTERGEEVYTRYTVCYTPEGQCCCSTYENPEIRTVSFADFDRDGTALQTVPLCTKWTVHAMKPSAAP